VAGPGLEPLAARSGMKDQNLSNRIVAALGPFCCTKSRGEPSSGPDQSGGGAERELCAA